MHVISGTEAAPAVITSKARRISGGTDQATGYLWTVYRIEDDFAFTVETSTGREIHRSAAEFPTAPKAERAAKTWCETCVEPAPAEEGRGAEAVMPAAVDEAAVCGWRIHVLDDRGGYQASLVADDDVTAVEVLPTCETHQDAVTAAIEWARENPCGNAEPTTPFDDTTDPRPLGVHTGELEIPAGREDPGANACPRPAGDDAPPALAPPPPATPPDPSRDWSTVDEVGTLLAERDAVDDRLALAEAAKQRAAAQAKEIRSELDELDARIRVARNNAERQRVLPLHPAPRTFATSETTRAKIGVDAAQVAERMTWAFNGVEHRICHESVAGADGPRFIAWIDGRRDDTEEFGESLEQAVAACQNAASIVFADTDPGQTTAGEDTGAIADGPRKTAKRGRPTKLKGHDKAAVIAAVESVLTWPEAAALLSCTTDQLEKFAAKVGINLPKHQGRRAGEELRLPEAPQVKAGKPRGRRSKGGVK